MCTISLHCKYRYANRFLNYNFKDETKYKNYIKNNKDLDIRIKQEINDLFSKSELIYIGKVKKDDSHNNFKYYVNIEQMISIITNMSDNIITCYQIDYGLNNMVNKTTAKAILKEINKLKNKISKEEIKISKQQEKLKLDLECTENNIENLKKQLEILTTKKDIINKKQETLEYNFKNQEYELEKNVQHLVYSCVVENNLINN